MATIIATDLNVAGVKIVTETTLTSSNTFTYREGVNQTLILRNPTAGALSPIIDGAGTSTVVIAGIGSIDLSAGFAVGSIAAGAVRSIRTESIGRYLQGVIDITSGTGLIATLLES